MEAWWALLLFISVTGALMAGFPVAFTLGGVSLWFALIGFLTGWFDADFIAALPNRPKGILNNATLMAVPVFVFMGVVLEKAKLAGAWLQNLAALLGGKKGGLWVCFIDSRHAVGCQYRYCWGHCGYTGFTGHDSDAKTWR